MFRPDCRTQISDTRSIWLLCILRISAGMKERDELMMRLLKRAGMLALALVLLICFASCKNEDKPAPETKGEEISLTNENGEVLYEVVRPDTCSEDVKNAAILLKKQLRPQR